SHYVVVQSASRVDFVSYPTVTAGSPTVFNATLGFYYYYWDFGDGTAYYGGVGYGGNSLAAHTYSRSGTYFVVLTGYNYTTGVFSTASHVLVVGSGVVAADFVYPTHNDGLTVSINAGSPAVFNATATGGSSPYQFAWTLGDGSSAVGQLPTHIFASPGSYIVALTVTDSLGNVAVASHSVTVASSPYLVDFTYPPVAPGSIVAFSGTSGFYYYYWDFGDGSTYQDYGSNGASIAYHAYSSAGPFIVVMTVSDSLGTATASHGFSTALFSDFTVSPTSVAAGHPVSFNVTSVQGGTPPYSFAWNFGDGTTGSGTSQIHTYSKTGTFIIVLEITDSSTPSANSLTIAHSITVVDFEIAATPTVLYAIPGQSSNSTISVSSKLGFTGPVVLMAVISPQSGLTCTITPGTVNLGTSEIAVLSCQGSVVTPFTVTVTGSASSGSHSVSITFYVTDFSIGASPTTITFDNGSSGDSTVYVGSIDGFSDPVTLSSTVLPSGLSCTIVPDIVTPSVYYYATSALSCRLIRKLDYHPWYHQWIHGNCSSLSRNLSTGAKRVASRFQPNSRTNQFYRPNRELRTGRGWRLHCYYNWRQWPAFSLGNDHCSHSRFRNLAEPGDDRTGSIWHVKRWRV
ncbi:MAG: PKD domain-containing protein, partial [Thaumarchaeota archaeon]